MVKMKASVKNNRGFLNTQHILPVLYYMEKKIFLFEVFYEKYINKDRMHDGLRFCFGGVF